jgi:hypothetical protein
MRNLRASVVHEKEQYYPKVPVISLVLSVLHEFVTSVETPRGGGATINCSMCSHEGANSADSSFNAQHFDPVLTLSTTVKPR